MHTIYNTSQDTGNIVSLSIQFVILLYTSAHNYNIDYNCLGLHTIPQFQKSCYLSEYVYFQGKYLPDSSFLSEALGQWKILK